ncbi:MAG: Mur ligase family protein [Hyphomicrobiaceae bacterium]
MICAATFAGKRVAGSGLAVARGRATVASLLAGGAEVAAWDDGEMRGLRRRRRCATGRFARGRLDEFAALVLAPGAADAPRASLTVVSQESRRRGHRRHRDFLPRAPRPRPGRAPRFIAITGTNGKSTTTALIAHILRRRPRRPNGRNIGTPVLALEFAERVTHLRN